MNGNKYKKTFWKNESNVGLRSQKGWKQGRVVGTVRGDLMLEKVWKQSRVVVTVHIAPWTHDYSITSSLHCSTLWYPNIGISRHGHIRANADIN